MRTVEWRRGWTERGMKRGQREGERDRRGEDVKGRRGWIAATATSQLAVANVLAR